MGTFVPFRYPATLLEGLRTILAEARDVASHSHASSDAQTLQNQLFRDLPPSPRRPRVHGLRRYRLRSRCIDLLRQLRDRSGQLDLFNDPSQDCALAFRLVCHSSLLHVHLQRRTILRR